MIITKNSNIQLTKNFNAKEFYSHCVDVLGSHYLDERLINAMQFIRDYYNVPVFITSSYRSVLCNTIAGGALNSQHLKGLAIDFDFKNENIQKKYINDILNKASIYYSLLSYGINGIGLYNGFNHIDTRDSNLQLWNESDIKKKVITTM